MSLQDRHRMCYVFFLWTSILLFGVQAEDMDDERFESSGPEITRIVGGDPVPSRDTYPFFSIPEPPNCGAFLVAPDIIVSAAHCSSLFVAGSIVHIGGLMIDGGDAQDSVVVSRSVVHPDFIVIAGSSRYRNDVLVVQLVRESTVTQFAQLNKISSAPLDTDDVVVMGHGTTSFGGSLSSVLLDVTVPIVASSTCRATYGSTFIREAEVICAGALGVDSCNGDSGGPLLLGDTVVGIVSWGPSGCGLADEVGVYVRVSTYFDFIQETICSLSSAELPSQFSCDDTTSECWILPFCPDWLELIFDLFRFLIDALFGGAV